MMNKKQTQTGHLISQLIDKSRIKSNLEKMLLKYELDNEILKIDDAFKKWRYSYEYSELTINTGFLNDLCDVLEKICRDKIQELVVC